MRKRYHAAKMDADLGSKALPRERFARRQRRRFPRRRARDVKTGDFAPMRMAAFGVETNSKLPPRPVLGGVRYEVVKPILLGTASFGHSVRGGTRP
jgi:hypothetical protein